MGARVAHEPAIGPNGETPAQTEERAAGAAMLAWADSRGLGEPWRHGRPAGAGAGKGTRNNSADQPPRKAPRRDPVPGRWSETLRGTGAASSGDSWPKPPGGSGPTQVVPTPNERISRQSTEGAKRDEAADSQRATPERSRKYAEDAQPAASPAVGFAWERRRYPEPDAVAPRGDESDASASLRPETRSVRPRTAMPETGQPPGRPPGPV